MPAEIIKPQRRPVRGEADERDVDRWLMESLLVFSSSEAVRGAAAAWLQAFDAARASGATAEEALASASRASPSRGPPG
jgi:hypothetical protein